MDGDEPVRAMRAAGALSRVKDVMCKRCPHHEGGAVGV
jgi:hypothetical protein